MRKLIAILTICIFSITAFTGCFFKRTEPTVDMSTFTDCGEETFIKALVTVGIPQAELEVDMIDREYLDVERAGKLMAILKETIG